MLVNPDKNADPLDKLIASVMNEMETYGPDSPEYPSMLAYLERLNDLKTPRRKKVNPDIMAGVLGNLAGILIIVSYEHMHVMTSKAIAFLGKTNLPTA